MTEHAVVIAGGGPTGMMLAGELTLAGVDVAIVERRASAESIWCRTAAKMAAVADPPYCIAATYDATAHRSSAGRSSANSGMAVPGVPTAIRRKMSSSDLLPITAGSARFAGGGPFSDFAFGPSPRPDSP